MDNSLGMFPCYRVSVRFMYSKALFKSAIILKNQENLIEEFVEEQTKEMHKITPNHPDVLIERTACGPDTLCYVGKGIWRYARRAIVGDARKAVAEASEDSKENKIKGEIKIEYME